jgi:hypothetical protein
MINIDSTTKFINYATKLQAEVVNHKIATNLSAIKKLLQVAIKGFAANDLYHHNALLDRPITQSMKQAVDWIGFYGTYKNLMFWINPPSNQTLDKEALIQSIASNSFLVTVDAGELDARKTWAEGIVKSAMQASDFNSKGEVREAIIRSLETVGGYNSAQAQMLAGYAKIQQKSRPLTLLFSTACFTVLDLTDNILVLKKWGLLDLSGIAAKIGSQSKIFYFVLNIGAEKFFGVVSSAALIVLVGDASYRAIINGLKHMQEADPKEKEEAYKKFREALIQLISGGADLINSAAPLLFTLNPPVVVALAIFAKGSGLICILIKD